MAIQPKPGSQGQGMPYEKVLIETIKPDDNYAVIRNEFGRTRQIPIHGGRSKGMKPVEGETWLITRDLGGWTFAMCLLPVAPIITGSTDGIPGLESLLQALDEAGLVIDQTTSTRIRATHAHTHVAPVGGGTTSQESPL